jgi:glycosyltransferase involved in cell wall biosynthesis/SAM-dependent methyltransferase
MHKFCDLKTESVKFCPVCKKEADSISLNRADGVPLIKCDECQSWYVSEYPIQLNSLYDQNYFDINHDSVKDGIGYQSGYTPIHEQLWQLGLILIASDILNIPCDNVLDIGSATGQFLELCRAFGAKELYGVEISPEATSIAIQHGFFVDNCAIEQYQPVQNFQIVTAWDLIEHLPNPHILAKALPDWTKENGLFCFSTPNGDAINSMINPEEWEGFSHSFEHIFYITQLGLNKLFVDSYFDILTYDLKIYGGDLKLGVAFRTPINAKQKQLLDNLFKEPDLLLSAARNGELSSIGISGLICLYMMFGHITVAQDLINLLLFTNNQLPSGIVELLQGEVNARLGNIDEAEQNYSIAAAKSSFSAREIVVSSQLALMQIYQQDKEGYIVSLKEQIKSLISKIEQIEEELQDSQIKRLASEEYTKNIQQEFKKFQEDFLTYKEDKELYISALKHELNTNLDISNNIKKYLYIKGKQKLLALLKAVFKKVLPPSIKQFWTNLSYESVKLQPIGKTVVYASDGNIYPKYSKRVDLAKYISSFQESEIKVTLITTVFNEGHSISSWLQHISNQTRLPDEIVIVDAGSTDNTLSIVEEFSAKSSLPIRIIVSRGANIAQGRNLAIQKATYPIIACTDLGSDPTPSWLEKLIAPFIINPETDVVAGWTKADIQNDFHKALGFLSVPSNYNQVDPQTYIPSSRTIAFTRNSWEKVGGYPEWATFAGEDSFFGIMLKNQCQNWAFVPEACVYWHMRNTWKAVYRQAYLYGVGDGELGINLQQYKPDIKYALLIIAILLIGIPATFLSGLISWWVGLFCFSVSSYLIWKIVSKVTNNYISKESTPDELYGLTARMLWIILAARLYGFVKGYLRRPLVLQNRYRNTIGTAIIFSGVPINDSGGGQRATQLALELLDQGYRVLFLNQYPSYESVDLRISIIHPHLEVNSVDAFDPTLFLKSHVKEKPLIAIAEFPHPNFLQPMMFLKIYGAKLVYDLIDDWSSSLGGDWYTEDIEKEFIDSCDLLVASATTLQESLCKKSSRQVLLVPNAVNTRLFKHGSYSMPSDMVIGSPTLIYTGALWGEWFDWDLLTLLAESYPKSSVVVIGDYRGQCPKSLPNLHFLGLKPQSSLPAYLAFADVALIPFKVSDLTQAVSPLKVFEYLAMGVPVVSTPLRELENLPYVYTGESHQQFIDQISVAVANQVDREIVAQFVKLNSWKQRVNTLLNELNSLNHEDISD